MSVKAENWEKIYNKFDGRYDDLVTAYCELESKINTLKVHNCDYIRISYQTAITSITALRHFNKKLLVDLLEYEQLEGYNSSIESVKRFMQLTEEAYKELQNKTGDKTPLDL